jgi:type IV secretion system protein TrbC
MKKLFLARVARQCLVPAVAAALYSGAALAQTTGTMPWDGVLSSLSPELSGPAAKAIGVIALAVSGGMLAFGGELNEFTKRIMMVVMAISVMILGNSLVNLIR